MLPASLFATLLLALTAAALPVGHTSARFPLTQRKRNPKPAPGDLKPRKRIAKSYFPLETQDDGVTFADTRALLSDPIPVPVTI